MKKLTIEALDGLFEYLNQPETVFWIRDQSYQKQIYISKEAEKIWGVPVNRFYDDSNGQIIKSSLIQGDGKEKWLALDREKTAIANKNYIENTDVNESADVLLRIKNIKGEEKYLLDSSYVLLGNQGEHLGFAGLAQTLSKEDWLARYYSQKSEYILNTNGALKEQVFSLLYKEAGLLPGANNASKTIDLIPRYYVIEGVKEVYFTPRESECIYYLQQGKTAKQTAELIHVSSRTVEYHIGNACNKAHARNKLELLSRIKFKI